MTHGTSGATYGLRMASARLEWMAGVVAAAPGERVLEVGCGHGVLVDLLAARGSEVLAVDRSPAMVAAAGRRNRAAVAAGRVRLQTATLLEAELGPRPFDAVVCFDVRAFWTPPAPEWDVVARVLAPGGRVVVGFSVMRPGADRDVAAAVGELAAPRGLVADAGLRRPDRPLPVGGGRAAPPCRAHPDGVAAGTAGQGPSRPGRSPGQVTQPRHRSACTGGRNGP